jgi:hypothetical protein
LLRVVSFICKIIIGSISTDFFHWQVNDIWPQILQVQDNTLNNTTVTYR